jgi:hypothetical protein
MLLPQQLLRLQREQPRVLLPERVRWVRQREQRALPLLQVQWVLLPEPVQLLLQVQVLPERLLQEQLQQVLQLQVRVHRQNSLRLQVCWLRS